MRGAPVTNPVCHPAVRLHSRLPAHERRRGRVHALSLPRSGRHDHRSVGQVIRHVPKHYRLPGLPNPVVQLHEPGALPVVGQRGVPPARDRQVAGNDSDGGGSAGSAERPRPYQRHRQIRRAAKAVSCRWVRVLAHQDHVAGRCRPGFGRLRLRQRRHDHGALLRGHQPREPPRDEHDQGADRLAASVLSEPRYQLRGHLGVSVGAAHHGAQLEGSPAAAHAAVLRHDTKGGGLAEFPGRLCRDCGVWHRCGDHVPRRGVRTVGDLHPVLPSLFTGGTLGRVQRGGRVLDSVFGDDKSRGAAANRGDKGAARQPPRFLVRLAGGSAPAGT
mmetsp:Transcript_15295/g.37006  ORF Transcript_15295/g.37006 Transcript_15295/m.37006 type:complete len:330 (+) Transcript_15295:439-1428(+)